MTRRMSKSEAREYQARWKLVRAREIDELRAASIQTRLRQFNTLLNWARRLKWSASLAADETEVRNRWARLRKSLRG